MKISVLIACHNRKELTLRCIESARSAAVHAGATIAFTVFDDGSTDGTSEAVAELPFSIQTLRGDGSAYWASGMAQAEAALLEELSDLEEDLIVWLNDDVVLDKESFSSLAASIALAPGSVIVGAMRDPETGETTYSGMRRSGLHPLSFEMVPPSDLPQPVETFNGNLVVVPVGVARRLGGIDGGFAHAFADIDYGLRLGRAGIPIILGAGTYGTCRRNEPQGIGRINEDWRRFLGPKGGGNYSSLRRILRKSHPLSWWLTIAVTYGLWWLRRLSGAVRSGRVIK
ncbi:glycosyltransferase family 2 protein [Arthrobacter sp. KN11-1C]|uniref:glycosyltransferase family 2 protein n=1 Tax=Arthrobacter sp. KN11-1C TaxID=3445774 RepID=UPI003FA18703